MSDRIVIELDRGEAMVLLGLDNRSPSKRQVIREGAEDKLRAALASESAEERWTKEDLEAGAKRGKEIRKVLDPESGEGEDWPDVELFRIKDGRTQPDGVLASPIPPIPSVEVRRYVPAPEPPSKEKR